MTSRVGLVLVLLAALGCIGCDQATKSLASAALRGEAPRVFLSGMVELRYAENAGGFLGLGADLPAPVRHVTFVLAAAGLLLALVWLTVRDGSPGPVRLLGVACVLGGGVGNLVDRLALGHVRDFAVLHAGGVSTGVFNVADVAVMLGCVMLALRGLLVASFLRWR
jgi:signal peptidase II